MNFYVGFDDLYYLSHFDRAFISLNRLRDRKSDFEVNSWILDSAAFTEISMHGRHRTSVDEYVKIIERWRECGNLECAVSQDWMCEPFILEKTKCTVAQHQSRTTNRFIQLSMKTDFTIMPVLQGFHPDDYLRHLDAYGDLLKWEMRVGVGSICKRNSHPQMIEYILRRIKAARPDLRLHGFGLKITALRRECIKKLLFSADSMAWSFAARKNGGNAHDWRTAKKFENEVNRQPEEFQLA